MATYIKYEQEDGTIILVETGDEKAGGVTRAGRDGKIDKVIDSATDKFEDAFAGVKKSAQILRQQLEEMRADEVEVTFGLKATGDFGNFAIGKVGAEVNYTVTMKWANKEKEAKSD